MQRVASGITASLALVLGLMACKPNPSPDATQITTTARPAPAPAPAANCPDPDFDSFLQRFEGSADAQRSATADPLTMVAVDPDAQPEPAPVSRSVPLSEVKFPLMADAPQRGAEGTEQTIQGVGASEREVTIRLPDSSAQVRFQFKATPCWTLVQVNDDSI